MLEKNNDVGFVRLEDFMGKATSIVNAARVSFGKKHNGPLREQDKKLIKYLWNNKHTSPFRHVYFTFHIKAPIFVIRQWQKHQVGCSWNELSGRYVKFDPSFYSPDTFREIPVGSVKQGSGESISAEDQSIAKAIYDQCIADAYQSYEALLKLNVCREQARMILPLSLFSECYWSCSLQAIIHFLKLRLAHDAQSEIRSYAYEVKDILEKDHEMKYILEIALNES